MRIPLVVQILALLLAGLVIAQIVTLLLTLILPPTPAKHHDLADIAAMMKGGTSSSGKNLLERSVQSGPPDISGAGWLVSENARTELAQKMQVPRETISLAFYTPLPFAGTTGTPQISHSQPSDNPFWIMGRAQAQTAPPPSAPPPPPQGTGAMPGGSLPPGALPGNGPGPGQNGPSSSARGGQGDGAPVRQIGRSLFDVERGPQSKSPTSIPGDGGAAVPPILGQRPVPSNQPPMAGAPPAPVTREMIGVVSGPPRLEQPLSTSSDRSVVSRQYAPRNGPTALPFEQPIAGSAATSSKSLPVSQVEPATRSVGVTQSLEPIAKLTVFPERALPINRQETGLFGATHAPFLEGDFVAAWRMAPGRWAVVQPKSDGFPSAWQKRVLLWFLLSFLLVVPLGWIFARRIVKPLSAFASAAEQLGRDPSAVVLDIDGPAEVGRAAHAFNVMQTRLKSFVDDRTAMVGAISHDLRTPLTRLRFRVEEVDDEPTRDGMVMELEEMEEMISSVLAFIRDASTPGVRDHVDLQAILSDVVDGAVRTGRAVTLELTQSALVEVDPLGMRRIFGNLIDNAIKYGGAARIRLSVDGNEALAEVIDNGPGIPDEEIERAFEPFYRSKEASSSTKQGSGLGLAVCRSIARAHGGDVRLVHTSDGFAARFNVPLAYAA
jgi:two-component system, OmpR family, sensor kinase